MPQFLKILITLAFFSYLLYRILKKKQAGTYRWTLVLAYVIRCISGMVYGHVFLKYYGGDDTWYYNRGGAEEFEKLKSSPLSFFTELGPTHAFSQPHGFAHNFYVYLNDLEFWLITKPLAIFHFFSAGDYSINSILFNFLSIWGSIWLFEAVLSKDEKQNRLLFGLLFFFPPFVFWLSGIRGDAFVFLFTVLAIIRYRNLIQKNFSWKECLLFLIGLAGITVFRSPVILVLLPALFAWGLHAKKGWSHIKSIGFIYGIGLLLFFASGLKGGGLPGLVAGRQAAFAMLRGNTRLKLPVLNNEMQSYLNAFPYAVQNVVIKPLPWQSKGLFQVAHSLETLLLLVLTSIALVKYKKNRQLLNQHPAALYSLIFAFSLLLFIGYTIPFPGAIIRYKIIASSFIYLALVASFWQHRNNQLNKH